MKALASIKKDLEFNRQLSSLIEVLKNISASQFRAAEQRMRSRKAFFLQAESFLDLYDTNTIRHPLLRQVYNQQAVIAVTSDSGLLGGLNAQVVESALNELRQAPGKLIVVGERGKVYAKEAGSSFVSFSGIKEEESFAQAAQLRDYCLNRVLGGAFGALKVVYPHPFSFTSQRPKVISLLPFAAAQSQPHQPKIGLSRVILESDIGEIVEYLVYIWMAQKLDEVFGLSRLAEFAARFIHLEESSERLKQMDAKMRLEYFRARHEFIDRDMRELFSARFLYS